MRFFFATYAHILLSFERSTETLNPFSIIFFLLVKISVVFFINFFLNLHHSNNELIFFLISFDLSLSPLDILISKDLVVISKNISPL